MKEPNQALDFRLYRQLWLFLVVAEEEHFGRAASRLAMSQPPLSEQIGNLEATLGTRLFDRSRRGTRLTAAGRALVPVVERFVSQARDLDFALREVVSGQTGVLRIGAITASMLDLVPRLMDRLTARHPRLSIRLIEIDSVEALPALDNGDIDIAFVRLDGRVGSGIATLPLSEDRLAVALSATHPLAGRSHLSLNDISEERFVFSARSVSPVYFDALLSACRGHGFAPRIHSEVRSIASQIAFVACNQGVALVPTAMAPLAPRGVVFLPLKEALSVVTLAAAWKTEHQNPMARDAILVLEDMIQESDIG